MGDTIPQEIFMMKTYCRFQLDSLEIFLGNRSLIHSPSSNCFLSFCGTLLKLYRMLDSNVTYCIIILVMLLGSSYAISVQRIKTLIGYRSMTLAPHEVHVLENNKWVPKSSYDLKPGDIINVTAGYQHKKVPH
jgi:magnesium-transporting ATPase (P-type)